MAELSRAKVCVIGAGAAGLCAARHFAPNSNFELKVYEQTNDIGGTWIYKEATEVDENGLPVHSSMYRDLRFNSTPCNIFSLILFETCLCNSNIEIFTFIIERIYQRKLWIFLITRDWTLKSPVAWHIRKFELIYKITRNILIY